MIRTEWRLDMRLKDAAMLRQYMEFKRLTIRELAHKAGVSHSTVGHLYSGRRRNARPNTARLIEEALGAPPGLLFEGVASNVSREVPAA